MYVSPVHVSVMKTILQKLETLHVQIYVDTQTLQPYVIVEQS